MSGLVGELLPPLAIAPAERDVLPFIVVVAATRNPLLLDEVASARGLASLGISQHLEQVAGLARNTIKRTIHQRPSCTIIIFRPARSNTNSCHPTVPALCTYS